MKRLLLISTIILVCFLSSGQNQTGKRFIPWLEANTAYLNGSIGSKTYQSGLMGIGWNITNSGVAEFDEVTVRKSLKAYELILQKIRSVNGGLVISAANAEVDSVTGGLAIGYTIYPKDTAITFMPNDLVRVQTWSGGGVKYYMGVVGSVDYTTHSFWMAEESFVGTDRPVKGDEMVQFGSLTDEERQGLIYLTAHDTYSPYIDVLDGVNATILTGLPKVRLGKLDGINSPTFGQLHGYGLYGSDVYLEGAIADTNGVLFSHHFAITDSSFSVLYARMDSAETTIQEHETRFLMTPDSISLTAVWDSINLLSGRVTSAETAYEQTAQAISLKANKSTTDSLGTLLDSAYARILLMPDSISLSPIRYTVDSLGHVIDSVWTRIALTPDSISLQAVKDSLDALGQKVDQNSAQLIIQADQISSKVSTTTYNTGISDLNSDIWGLDYRLTSAESSITQNSDQIATKVSTVTYESGMAVKENSIVKSSSSPSNPYTGQLWISTATTPNILYRYNGASWTKVTPTTAAEVGAFSASDGSILTGRVSTAESSITQNANNIALKVSQTDFNLLDGKVSSAESNITQTANDVTFGFSRIGVDGYARTGKTVVDATGLTVYDGGIKIKNNAGTDVLSADVNGNLSLTGNINATSGTFTGTVNATTLTGNNGTIGNYSISTNGLTNLTGESYILCRDAGSTRVASIGTSTLPATLGGTQAMGYFKNTTVNDWATNYGIYAAATNAGVGGTAYAGYFSGDVAVTGVLRSNKIPVVRSGDTYKYLGDEEYYWEYAGSGSCTVCLPSDPKLGMHYIISRTTPGSSLTVIENVSEAKIRFGDVNTTSAYVTGDLCNAYVFVWNGSYWMTFIWSRG